MDCPDACALEVEVENDRVQSIRGRQDHPNTAGFICSKVANFGRRLEHPDRLLYPMRRVGEKGEGKFARISWQEAIDKIAERFKSIGDEWGGEAIVPFHYGGSNGLLTDSLLDGLFFERLGASHLQLTICAVPTTEVAKGMYGKIPGVAFEDFVHARCIIVWGANPKASNIHLVPYLREASERPNAEVPSSRRWIRDATSQPRKSICTCRFDREPTSSWLWP
jgi:anaerobic selenocysteine-containing dehydrogenase